MKSVALGAATVDHRPPAPAGRGPFPDAAGAAWLLAVPCAIATAAAVLLLGPPLSRVLFPAHPPFTLLSQTSVAPEPVEDTRYLITLGGPVLLALMTAAAVRRPSRPMPRAAAAGAIAAQILAVALLAGCLVGQHRHQFGRVYFSAATLAAAAAIACALLVASRAPRIRARAAGLMRESPPRRAAALAAAGILTLTFALAAINSAHSIAWSVDTYDAAFQFDEAFAVINGLTPLVDFSAQYSSLWPFLSALPLLAFGKTLLVFTITMSAIGACALLAVYGVLRRAARSAIAALLLFAPFLATSFFIVRGTPLVRFSFGTYFPMLPLRYGGPYLLAWLIARRLDRGARGPPWPLFLLAGLVLLNNSDFGIAAFGATIAALACTSLAWQRRAILRLAAHAALGLAAAYALVSALTLARAGALPDPARLVVFARIYAIGGFTARPLPGILGLPLAIYLTYVAAIGVAAVRALRRAPNRVLTGMLAWIGVFGLGSAGYYVGRSDPETLPAVFSAWALALALLSIVAWRQLATASAARRMSIAAVAALFGLSLAACSLAQTSAPWSQIARIEHQPAGVRLSPIDSPYTPSRRPAVRRFVSSLADGPRRFVLKPGAPVALFWTTGHRIADAYGIADVVPFTGIESLHTAEQLDEALAALRAAGGNTVLIPPFGESVIYQGLARRGFELLTTHGLRRFPLDGALGSVADVVQVEGLTKWVDARHLRAPALR